MVLGPAANNVPPLKRPNIKEFDMSHTGSDDKAAIDSSREPSIDMKLEVVVIPVSDVDAAKRYYARLGWRLDADFAVGDAFRVVQFTPPGSSCSIHFGRGLTSAAPGSAQGLYLVVADIEAARAELVSRGADVSEIAHRNAPGAAPLAGPHPQRQSYASFASFNDLDHNRWLIQEVTQRLPGRVDAQATAFGSVSKLAAALRRAAKAHGEHDGGGADDADWPERYAEYIAREQSGNAAPS
jgi:catechol 2,3-dioxygenase-like lactoylglutathione lyase family enzyme